MKREEGTIDMNTFFLSPERSDQKTILEENRLVQAEEILIKTLDSLTSMVAIINAERQAVLINKAFLDALGSDSMDTFLGKRPGEMLHCIHAQTMEAGCGTSLHCQYCGAGQSIAECQRCVVAVTKECRITTQVGDAWVNLDLKVTSSPLNIQGEEFTLFVAIDICDEKRRHALERIFFHDVINKAGSLKGFVEMLQDSENDLDVREELKILRAVSSDLLEEILSQRDLARAEKGEITLHPELFDPVKLIEAVAKQIEVHPVNGNRKIVTKVTGHPSPVFTDRVILNRILTNMVKNAVEAITNGSTVTIDLSENDTHLIFKVHNDSVMSDEVKAQVFQRSFSTKGMDRGLGTYSMKLLGEKYLHGQVSFSSDESGGTLFTIAMPKQFNR
ncbi:MAG: HAMP domain-containing sensor histidine kinase [Bacteroidales bacterium]|nr:HAMP domain-containing sensor histidine kinase [Bacteroidales bacterium]